MPGEYDRYNMKRVVSLTANIAGEDLGRVSNHVDQAIARAGEPPKGATVEVRGQIAPMREILRGLAIGLGMAIVVIMLLLTANFQSVRLALVVISTTPAVVAGVVVALWLTATTVNLESFMGAIMAIGVAVANAILLVTFAEHHRREQGASAGVAAVAGAQGRLRPILMTSCAMTAGMIPLALGWSEGSEQTAPLGRAVIGGLAAATLATLVVLPTVFTIVQNRAGRRSASIDPADPESSRYDPAFWGGEAPAALVTNGEPSQDGLVFCASIVRTPSQHGTDTMTRQKTGPRSRETELPPTNPVGAGSVRRPLKNPVGAGSVRRSLDLISLATLVVLAMAAAGCGDAAHRQGRSSEPLRRSPASKSCGPSARRSAGQPSSRDRSRPTRRPRSTRGFRATSRNGTWISAPR